PGAPAPRAAPRRRVAARPGPRAGQEGFVRPRAPAGDERGLLHRVQGRRVRPPVRLEPLEEMGPSRLFTRVLVALLAVFGLAAVLSATLAARALAGMMEAQYKSKGTAIAATIARACVDDLLLGRDVAALQARVDQYARTEGVAYILVREASGEV